MLTLPESRTSDLVIQQSIDETLVYDLATDKAYCLNKTSSLVWKNCNGRRSIQEICDVMSAELGELVDEDIVWLALQELAGYGLLEKGNEVTDKFHGTSRRDVIRKIGLGSAIALPIISSIIAPNAISAQSCVNPGGFAPGTDVGCFSASLPGCGATAPTLCCSGSATRGTPPGPCTGMTASCFCD